MTWFAPGADGQSGLLLGANEADFSFEAVLYDSLANVLAWYGKVQAAQGTVITITDDWGTPWANCLIQEVSLLHRTPAQGSGVGGVDTRGDLTIRGVVVL